MSEITPEMARAKIRRMLWMYFVGVPALLGFLAWLNRYSPPPVQLSPEEQAARDAHFELMIPWLLSFATVAGPCMFGSMFWMVKWSMKMPRERTPKVCYFFGVCGALICGGLGIVQAVNDGLNAFGVGLICGFLGLMFGLAIGSIVAAPRDAAVGAAFGLAFGTVFCAYLGIVQWNFAKPLWGREAWEARVFTLASSAFVGGLLGISVLRIRRYKRQLAGEQVHCISR